MHVQASRSAHRDASDHSEQSIQGDGTDQNTLGHPYAQASWSSLPSVEWETSTAFCFLHQSLNRKRVERLLWAHIAGSLIRLCIVATLRELLDSFSARLVRHWEPVQILAGQSGTKWEERTAELSDTLCKGGSVHKRDAETTSYCICGDGW